MRDLSYYLKALVISLELIVLTIYIINQLVFIYAATMAFWILCIGVAVVIFIKLESNTPTEEQREKNEW